MARFDRPVAAELASRDSLEVEGVLLERPALDVALLIGRRLDHGGKP